MAGLRRISYLWKDADSARDYSTGVSLHSHTSQSKETLDFLANFGNDYSWVRKIIALAEARARDAYQISINYAASYWTPPLTPRLAFDLETRQIEETLDLMPLVSITDHDNINAPLPLPVTFPSLLSGACLSAPTSPFTSVSTTCPVTPAPTGCAPLRNSPP